MHDTSEFSTLLQTLYAAPLDGAGWQPLAGLLARHYGGHSGFIGIRDALEEPGVYLSWTDNLLADNSVGYRTMGYRKDVLRGRGIEHAGRVIGLDDVTSEAEYLRSDYYNQCCRPFGIFHSVGFFAPLDRSGTRGILGIHRARRRGTFDRDTKQRMTLLIPHFAQALQLHRRLQRTAIAQAVSLNALEALQLGALVVDDSGRLLFASSIAEAMLRTQHELSLRQGRLRLRDPDQHAALQEAVRTAARLGIGRITRHDNLFRIGTRGDGALSLQIYPAPPGLIVGAPACPAAFIFLSGAAGIPASLDQRLCALYELTPMEARLASAIIAGNSLAEFSAQAGISINTAKTYMKRLFAKSGHRRQSHFVRDALANPILHMAMPDPGSRRH